MADQNPFTIEERLIMAVWVNERPQTGQNLKEVFQTFQRRFNKEPPTKAAALAWERKLFASGSIEDSPRSGRPKHEPAEVKKSPNQFSVHPRNLCENVLQNWEYQSQAYTAISRKIFNFILTAPNL
jgi:hypothetical protein